MNRPTPLKTLPPLTTAGLRTGLGRVLLWVGMIWLILFSSAHGATPPLEVALQRSLKQVVADLSQYPTRATGSPGCDQAADYIEARFKALGIEKTGRVTYTLPVRTHNNSQLTVYPGGRTHAIEPFVGNAISPQSILEPGIDGPLYYVADGQLSRFNGKAVKGAVILMELDSGKNWLNAATLGAKALIFVDRGDATRNQFEDKQEFSPLDFPRFWMSLDRAQALFGGFDAHPDGLVTERITLTSDIRWANATPVNVYAFLPGSDPELAEEMVLIEAFFDSTQNVIDKSPGADESLGLATLVSVAETLTRVPPRRSILLLATSGHAQTLAGFREAVWSINTRSKEIRKRTKQYRNDSKTARGMLKLLKKGLDGRESLSPDQSQAFKKALDDQIKTRVDQMARRLMYLRMEGRAEDQDQIKQMAERRLTLRRLGWKRDLSQLTAVEVEILAELLPLARTDYEALVVDARRQQKFLTDASSFRSLVKSKELVAVISLHLSSHGDGVGAFNKGWMFNLKPHINRVVPYSMLNDVLQKTSRELGQDPRLADVFKDTLRPNRRKPWQSHFLDRPALGGEISSVAGYVGVSLVTTHDGRFDWGTPRDTVERMDWVFATRQARVVTLLMQALGQAPQLASTVAPRDGLGTVFGRAKFLRHGELFADQPAPNTMILAYQGRQYHHAMVDAWGNFHLKGIADKKHVLDKVIIEGYRFDPQSGQVVWAIDKKQTGKEAYRVKMNRRFMETDLVMFGCKQTTIFDLLEPRTFNYMTKLDLIDGRREALPLRYWYSRIDTRESILSSIYTEPGTRLKLTLSDNTLSKKLILTNGSDTKPMGSGYRVELWPAIHLTELSVARDMWHLNNPRIENLENKGIFNERIRTLREEGVQALTEANQAYQSAIYDRSAELARKSWALASRVYEHVQKTQKDVLFGVLFYIALFVPFAFCMERLLFSFTNIYKRILAFCGILIVLIAIIYQVHPAFKLAYSPMVVILAFFIMGLSLIVTLIIFFRFEEEMTRLQTRATHIQAGEIGRWKAFVAAFLLGVSNLRRRRLRTFLTCSTLIILTFTIMSFTSVKSVRHHARLLFKNSSPYQGFLLKKVNWNSLPPEGLSVLRTSFGPQAVTVPRVWYESDDQTHSLPIPIYHQGRSFEALGLVGLSHQEAVVTGLDRVLVGGRWFEPQDRQAVIMPERMARQLGIDPKAPQGAAINFWGARYAVVGVFSGEAYAQHTDLDGEILTPAIFPSEAALEMTDVEMDALESGDDVGGFQSRYQHVEADLTLLVPAETLLAAGGKLKAVAVRPLETQNLQTQAQQQVDRFGLTLFSGEPQGTYLYHASDTISYSGVPNLIIPIIISVFIVLNTMIGAVYERKREIAVYTSVGLAPSHVSFLFVAEAMAFAVISVVLGYLLAQISASLFAGSSLWSGITVNYSSLAGVGAMLLVISVVLISVIYPSRVAAEIAIPDVTRAWTLPEAQDNRMDITLPFLLKHSEHSSVGAFLVEFFKAHQDVSHGMFSTGEVDHALFSIEAMRKGETSVQTPLGPACFKIQSRVWLAPFDLGIMQTVNLYFCKADSEPEFLEIRVRLERQSGEANAWRRINKVFLLELRKQLLLWRSLDAAQQNRYREAFTVRGFAS